MYKVIYVFKLNVYLLILSTRYFSRHSILLRLKSFFFTLSIPNTRTHFRTVG